MAAAVAPPYGATGEQSPNAFIADRSHDFVVASIHLNAYLYSDIMPDSRSILCMVITSALKPRSIFILLFITHAPPQALAFTSSPPLTAIQLMRRTALRHISMAARQVSKHTPKKFLLMHPYAEPLPALYTYGWVRTRLLLKNEIVIHMPKPVFSLQSITVCYSYSDGRGASVRRG